MTTIQKIINSVLVIGVIIVGFTSFNHSKTLGDATVSNYPTWYYGGIQIGPNGNVINNVIDGSCNLATASSVADRATESLTCTITGAVVGDKVFMTQPTVGSNGSFPIVAASVTSANTVTAVLQNQSGGSATPNGGSITGVYYTIFR